MTKNSLQQKHKENCRLDIAAIFGMAAHGYDAAKYALWLSRFRRLNWETLPRIAFKRENLNVLFTHPVNDHFLEMYTALPPDTETFADDPEARPEAVEVFALEDTRTAIKAAYEFLQDEKNLTRVKASQTIGTPAAMMADSFLQTLSLPDDQQLQDKIDRRLETLKMA